MNMKKWIIITTILVVLGILIVLIINDIKRGGPVVGTIIEGRYTKDDNFLGTNTGEKGNDRDGVFNSLAISQTDPNNVYVGTEGNGIFHSKDGGTTWEWLLKGIWHTKRGFPEVYDIAFDPKDESTLYAALTNGPIPPSIDKAAGVYTTNNSGEYWNRFTEGLPNTGINSIAIMQNPKTIFAGIDGDFPSNNNVKERPKGGIYKSKDNGQTWEAVNITEKGIYNRFTHSNIVGQPIYASGMSFGKEDGNRKPDPNISVGLIKSTDGGNSWKIIQPPNTLAYYYDVTSDGETIYFNNALGKGDSYKSVDGGATWKQLNLNFSNVIEIAPFNKEFVIYANGNQLLKSTDGMKTSKEVHRPNEALGFDDIEFTSNPNIIYAAGAGYRIYKSTNAGETWKQIANLRDKINKK